MSIATEAMEERHDKHVAELQFEIERLTAALEVAERDAVERLASAERKRAEHHSNWLKACRARDAAESRAEAEQRVLDAMARLDEMQLQMVAEEDDDGMWVMPAVAELARRGLKP